MSTPNQNLGVPLDENKEFSREWDLFLEEITEENKKHAGKINNKERSFYPLDFEILNDQKFFTNATSQEYRSIFRKVFNFGALPNAGTKNAAHGLSPDSSWLFTRINGFARDPSAPEWLPIPNDNIFIKVDTTNIVITTTADFSAFTESYIVLEYSKY